MGRPPIAGDTALRLGEGAGREYSRSEEEERGEGEGRAWRRKERGGERTEEPGGGDKDKDRATRVDRPGRSACLAQISLI